MGATYKKETVTYEGSTLASLTCDRCEKDITPPKGYHVQREGIHFMAHQFPDSEYVNIYLCGTCLEILKGMEW